MRYRKAMEAKRKTTKRKTSKITNKQSGNGSQLAITNKSNPKTQRFVKTVFNHITIAGQSRAEQGAGEFMMSDVPQFQELLTLYNRYRLNKIILTIRAIDQATGVSFAQSQMPTLYHRYSYDSNLTVTTIQDKLQNCDNAQNFTFTLDKTKLQYTLRPRTISPVYYNITASGYKLNPPTYIDCAYSSVPHYGWMYYIDNLLTGFTIAVDVTYDFSMKYIQ